MKNELLQLVTMLRRAGIKHDIKTVVHELPANGEPSGDSFLVVGLPDEDTELVHPVVLTFDREGWLFQAE